MKVLHVNKFLYRRGGAEAYMLDVAAAQVARGDEVAFFAMDHPDNEPSPYDPWFPDRVELSPPPLSLGARAAAAGRMLWSTTAATGLAHVVRHFRPDVAHLHNVYHHLSPSVLRPLRQAGVPVAMTLHDYKLVCPTYQLLDHGRPCEACIDKGMFEPVRRRCKDGSLRTSALLAAETWVHRQLGLYEGVQVFIAPSAFLAERMARSGIGVGRVRTIDHFVEARPAGPFPREPRVVVAGRLEHEKGVDVAVRAVGRIPELVLDVAGEGSQRAALEDLAARLAPGRVTFHGRLPKGELLALVSRATAVALPSRWSENQPLSVLEAMACATVVVASAVGGVPELVDDGRTGILVPPNDRDALAAALGSLVVDRCRLSRLGSAAHDEARRRFALDRHLAALDLAYLDAGHQPEIDAGSALRSRSER